MAHLPKVKGIMVNKDLICKAWEKCIKYFAGALARKSWSSNTERAHHRNYYEKKRGSNKRVAPEGYILIYVGARKERFVMKTEYLNHRLFRSLLEEAESEYGFTCEGPLLLPSGVDDFVKVLTEIEDCFREEEIGKKNKGCISFVARDHHSSSYDRLLTLPTVNYI